MSLFIARPNPTIDPLKSPNIQESPYTPNLEKVDFRGMSVPKWRAGATDVDKIDPAARRAFERRLTSGSLHQPQMEVKMMLETGALTPDMLVTISERVKQAQTMLNAAVSNPSETDFGRLFEGIKKSVEGAWNRAGLTSPRQSLSFADIEILAGASTLTRRNDASIASRVCWNRKTNQALIAQHPFIPANMKSVTDLPFAKEVAKLGGLPILRFCGGPSGSAERLACALELGEHAFVTVRSRDEELAAAFEALEKGARGVCIEMANAYSPQAIKMLLAIKERFPERYVVVGNVASAEGYLLLALAGADAVKVGRGSGAACSTPEVTGLGTRQMSLNIEVGLAQALLMLITDLDVPYWSDGGASDSAHIGFAAFVGSEGVMMGSTFAGTVESAAPKYPDLGLLLRGKIPTPNDLALYFGEASQTAAELDGQSKQRVRAQGEEGLIPVSGTLAEKISRLSKGLQAIVADSGVKSFIELVSQPSGRGIHILEPGGQTERKTRIKPIGWFTKRFLVK